MSIDIKSLRIGSHILVNGKRERVRGLDEDNGLIIRFPAEYVSANEVEPIKITPELLKELGFVNTSSSRRIVYTKGCEYDGLWYEVRNLKDRWEVFVSDNNWDGRIIVRYLHELEAFLYLTTQTELIPTDMAGFKTLLQERAERDIFSKDKKVANKAMEILLDEADRLIEAHRRVFHYQRLLASPAMMGHEIKFNGSHGILCERSVPKEV